MANIDIALFEEQDKKGFITGRKHPELDLIIWNYTAQCQYERAWNDECTMLARGLVTTPDGEIVARCMRKFFNLSEYKYALPDESFKVTEKWDGSMILVFTYQGEIVVATRGSFVSEQAQWAREILQEKYADFAFDPEYTYVFELIHPHNRVVINYGEMRDLVLLAVIETETGAERDIHAQSWPFPVTKYYDIADLAEIKHMHEENKEGFVVRFENGVRVKAKYDEYVRLHVMYKRVTGRLIWEHLRTATSLKPLIEELPDELYAWVHGITSTLGQKYTSLYRRTQEAYKAITASLTINVPFSVGATMTYKQYMRLQSEIRREKDRLFREYPELFDFLVVLDEHPGDKGKQFVKDIIWASLDPGAIRPVWNTGEEE